MICVQEFNFTKKGSFTQNSSMYCVIFFSPSLTCCVCRNQRINKKETKFSIFCGYALNGCCFGFLKVYIFVWKVSLSINFDSVANPSRRLTVTRHPHKKFPNTCLGNQNKKKQSSGDKNVPNCSFFDSFLSFFGRFTYKFHCNVKNQLRVCSETRSTTFQVQLQNCHSEEPWRMMRIGWLQERKTTRHWILWIKETLKLFSLSETVMQDAGSLFLEFIFCNLMFLKTNFSEKNKKNHIFQSLLWRRFSTKLWQSYYHRKLYCLIAFSLVPQKYAEISISFLFFFGCCDQKCWNSSVFRLEFLINMILQLKSLSMLQTGWELKSLLMDTTSLWIHCWIQIQNWTQLMFCDIFFGFLFDFKFFWLLHPKKRLFLMKEFLIWNRELFIATLSTKMKRKESLISNLWDSCHLIMSTLLLKELPSPQKTIQVFFYWIFKKVVIH